jgi:hypothetical protein
VDIRLFDENGNPTAGLVDVTMKGY